MGAKPSIINNQKSPTDDEMGMSNKKGRERQKVKNEQNASYDM